MQFQSEMEQNFVEENSTAEDLSDFCLLKENIKFFSWPEQSTQQSVTLKVHISYKKIFGCFTCL